MIIIIKVGRLQEHIERDSLIDALISRWLVGIGEHLSTLLESTLINLFQAKSLLEDDELGERGVHLALV